jgi:hypothetical protein
MTCLNLNSLSTRILNIGLLIANVCYCNNELERLKIDWYDIDAIASASASASANQAFACDLQGGRLSLGGEDARRKLVMGLARRSCTEVLARRYIE